MQRKENSYENSVWPHFQPFALKSVWQDWKEAASIRTPLLSKGTAQARALLLGRRPHWVQWVQRWAAPQCSALRASAGVRFHRDQWGLPAKARVCRIAASGAPVSLVSYRQCWLGVLPGFQEQKEGKTGPVCLGTSLFCFKRIQGATMPRTLPAVLANLPSPARRLRRHVNVPLARPA